MENRVKHIKIKRFLTFIFDFIFIGLLAFTLYMLLGLIFRLDSVGFQNYLIYHLLVIIITYLFFGEIIFKNTLGKYLFGIEIVDNEKAERPPLQSLVKRGLLKILFPVEGLVLLISGSGKRLGDLWADTSTINKATNRLSPAARLMTGILAIIVLLFSLRISMGLAVKKTDFYSAGITYLKNSNTVEITGLPKVVNLTRNSADFIVPVSNRTDDKYAIIYLDKDGNEWSVNHFDLTKEHIMGFSYGLSYSDSGQ
jgi:uncharacterized RDD family membrane protein YckC